jgi:uncharacterized membrane protein YeaQ/YmgE (transglycosylase-associated protein family)
MNILMWMLAGGFLGWAGYSFLGFNEGRGMMVSVVIGTLGGFIGGNVIAPLFSAAAAIPGDFNTSALFFAAAVAAVFLSVGNLVYTRWGV